MAETFDWVKPSLLWQANGRDVLRPDFFKPRLLEFNSDNFMTDFLAAASAPQPDAFQQAIASPLRQGAPLKLYQPVHGNFYLACSSLCCRVPGFPDREVQRGDGEKVYFVLRKQVDGVEYGWKAGETDKGWKPLSGPATDVLKDEEQLPLFPVTTVKNRFLFYGYVPVSSQDSYAAARTDSPVDYTTDVRIEELRAIFIDPLKNSLTFSIPASADPLTSLRISVYMLLALWEYFKQYLPDVADAMRGDASANPNTDENALINFIKGQALGGTLDLATALGDVARRQDYLDQPSDSDLQGFNSDYSLQNLPTPINTDGLETALSLALQSHPSANKPQIKVPKLGQKAGDFYVLRFVYERPQCDPAHKYVSQPTERFQLAPFFDPDAPARPIRVGLPVDVSIGGLRKFKKNVAFMMSKELRKKMSGVNPGMLKGGDPDGEDSTINIGHICSFSIPIITICAFILLMIIVIILNLIFFWLPLLKICFPLKLEAKT